MLHQRVSGGQRSVMFNAATEFVCNEGALSSVPGSAGRVHAAKCKVRATGGHCCEKRLSASFPLCFTTAG